MRETENTFSFLQNGGEMGQLMRSFDWENNPLGSPDLWPESLKIATRICLDSRFPIVLWWGKDLRLIYNDAWRPSLGTTKHPWALGRKGKEVWLEIWDTIGPMLEHVLNTGEATWVDDGMLLMERYGYIEESYWTYSYSAIRNETGEVCGVFTAVHETTKTVLGERHLRTLRDLSAGITDEKTLRNIYSKAAEALSKNNKDFPFVIFYEIQNNGTYAEQVAWAGIEKKHPSFPQSADTLNPTDNTSNFCKAFQTHEILVVENNGRRVNIPYGNWDIPPTHFVHVPIFNAFKQYPYAMMVMGVNPYRKLDDNGKRFIKLIADQIANDVTNVLAYEEEKKKAAALAEIDLAKTTFFNNISHEFRTPLTLILGPLEDMLNNNEKNKLLPKQEELIVATHRNAMRLLRLVNSLLDFSRIEAGKVKPNFQLVDIARHTVNLTSTFRSVIEKAGLQFIVECSNITGNVYTDPEMWEKIVLNLLSNAFKYTLAGTITVKLKQQGDQVILRVEDTGTGIPETALPHIFERFHRIENAGGRTNEGTGIGLSLIYELVKLHHGNITVESVFGKGATFIVSIPSGTTHFTENERSAVSMKATGNLSSIYQAFVIEASSLLSSDQVQDKDALASLLDAENEDALQPSQTVAKKATILLADDNKDMRSYVKQLLKKHFNVITAVNGKDALEKLAVKKPDLIISDIMMPVMNGHELLKAIKDNPETTHIPVMLLSARAGEEAKVESFESGADDYLIKPFSAKELIARVRSQVQIAKTRTGTEQHLRNLLMQTPIPIFILKGPRFIVDLINDKCLELWAKSKENVINRPIFDVFAELRNMGFEEILEHVYENAVPFTLNEQEVRIIRDGEMQTAWFNVVYEPLKNEDDNVFGIMGAATEITGQVLARKATEENEEKLRKAQHELQLSLSVNRIGIWHWDVTKDILKWSKEMAALYEDEEGEFEKGNKKWEDFVHPEDLQRIWDEYKVSQQTGDIFEYEYRIITNNKNIKWIKARSKTFYNDSGKAVYVTGVNLDVTNEKQIETILKEKEAQFTVLANAMPQLVWMADPAGKIFYYNDRIQEFSGAERNDHGEWYWEGMLHPEDIKSTAAAWFHAVLTGNIYVTEHRVQIADGSFKWFLSRAIPQRDENGNILKWFGTATDIDEQKRASEAVKESEQRFRLLSTSIAQIVWITNPDGTTDYLSDQWYVYTGQPKVNNEITVMEYIHPDDVQGVIDKWAEALNTGNSFFSEHRLKNIDGAYRWFMAVTMPLKDDDGNIKKWIGSATEIHEMKMHEQRKDDFIKIASHELKTPVTSIKGYIQLLLKMYSQSGDKLLMQSLNTMERQIIKLTKLIADMLDVTKIELGALAFHKAPVILNELLLETAQDIKAVSPSHEIFIKPSQPLKIIADKDRIAQVIINLLTNAIKYSPGQDKIIVEIKQSESSAIVSVQDFGIGIEPTDHPRVFERFYRAQVKEDYAFPGFGIGLYIASEIIKQHHGEMWIESDKNKGSTFYFSLPLAT